MASVKYGSIDMTKWRELERRISALGNVHAVRVGILPGSMTDDGQNIAEYACYNEFGTSHIPARPFMRTTAQQQGKKWAGILAGALRGQIGRSPDALRRAFMAVGRVAQSDIQATIMSHMPPPNNPQYAARKVKENGGYSGTLFNTGQMLQSINFELVNGFGESDE